MPVRIIWAELEAPERTNRTVPATAPLYHPVAMKPTTGGLSETGPGTFGLNEDGGGFLALKGDSVLIPDSLNGASRAFLGEVTFDSTAEVRFSGKASPAFTIDEDFDTPQPTQVIPHPRPIIGRTISGKPVYQGKRGIEVVFAILDQDRMTKLKSFYNEINPRIRIRYYEPRVAGPGLHYAKMHEPVIGSAQGKHYYDVRVVIDEIEL